ncbi:MAG: hypothetical protein WBL61_13320, partial [Bryobacteraceae bacterium]
MKAVNIALELALLGAGLPGLLSAIDLQPDTLKAWGEYIRNADSRMQPWLDSRQPFLWSDESPDRSRRLRRGETLVV